MAQELLDMRGIKFDLQKEAKVHLDHYRLLCVTFIVRS
jgi:hypothetical protein